MKITPFSMLVICYWMRERPIIDFYIFILVEYVCHAIKSGGTHLINRIIKKECQKLLNERGIYLKSLIVISDYK